MMNSKGLLAHACNNYFIFTLKIIFAWKVKRVFHQQDLQTACSHFNIMYYTHFKVQVADRISETQLENINLITCNFYV